MANKGSNAQAQQANYLPSPAQYKWLYKATGRDWQGTQTTKGQASWLLSLCFRYQNLKSEDDLERITTAIRKRFADWQPEELTERG